MTTTDLTVAIANTRAHLEATTEHRKAAQRVYDEARAARDALGYETAGTAAKVKLRILRAEDALEEAEARLGECRRIAEVAHTQWATLVRQAYRARHQARLEAARVTAQALVAALAEDAADHQAVAQQLGVVEPDGHPQAIAAQMVRALDTELRTLTRPPTAGPPVLAGQRRVKILVPFKDAEHVLHTPTYAGVPVGPEDLDEKDATEAISRGWAAPVEMGG